MDFEAYLVSKKIDEVLFKEKENTLWFTWSQEFATMHPNSFTAQKLYLLNPIRRKYPLKQEVVKTVGSEQPTPSPSTKPAKPAMVKPATPKPVPTMPAPTLTGAENNLAESTPAATTEVPAVPQAPKPSIPKPAIPRPVMKPKPKTDS